MQVEKRVRVISISQGCRSRRHRAEGGQRIGCDAEEKTQRQFDAGNA